MIDQVLTEFHPRICVVCGNTIPKGEHEKLYVYNRRKFCGSKCSNKYFRMKRKILKSNPCLNCGKMTSNEKYCSNKCQRAYEQKVFEEKWLNGETSGNANSDWIQPRDKVRTYLFKKYNNKCSRCGWGEVNPFTGRIPLEVEHIDGNANNTTPDNVTLLCPNCHSLTSTYRGANRGKGRGKTWRPK